MTWARVSLLSVVLLCCAATGCFAAATPHGTREDRNSSGQVHISVALNSNDMSLESGPTSWEAHGFDLKSLIAELYGIDSRRIDFEDSAAAGARYDVSVRWDTEQSDETIKQTVREALLKKLRLAVSSAQRAMDVYVLSAPKGAGAALHLRGSSVKRELVEDDSDADVQRITFIGKQCSGVASGGIAASGGTMSEFREALEADLDRPLLDETNLQGSYDFTIGSYSNQQELFQLLKEQLGISVVPATRDVTVLQVRMTPEATVAAL